MVTGGNVSALRTIRPNPLPLRHNAFEPESAGVREDKRAVLLVHVLVETQPRRCAREQAGERGLSYREQFLPQVIASELDQIKGIEEHGRVVPPIADAVETRDPVLAACHRLAVMQDRERSLASASTMRGKR